MNLKNVLLAFIAFILAVSAQAQTFTRSGEVPLSDALSSVEQQTGYLFVYDSAAIDSSVTVKLDYKDAPLQNVLTTLLKPLGIKWKISGRNIILTKDERKTDKSPFTMSGEVLENGGVPVIGAVVQVVGKEGGEVTDENGRFVYQGLVEGDVLKVSCLGFRETTVKASRTSSATIYLMVDSQMMDEVVVIGYGATSSKEVTSAIATISADELMKGVGGADVTKALQGKIPGLVISQTKSVNDSPSMQLRGMASIVAGQEPLIVIDGFAGGDIRSLNPEDIKSIDVLKDASAGAIYGTRAAAGVILITTKSGADTQGRLNLTYSAEMLHKQGYGKPDIMTAEEYVAAGIGKDYGSRVDWWEEGINRKNFSHKHNLSINFGTEKATVYSSFFYEKQDGLADGEWRRDYGGRINAKYTFFEGWLDVRANVDYRQASRNRQGIYFGQTLFNNPTRSPYDPDSVSGYNIWNGEANDYNVIADAKLCDNNGITKWFKPEASLKLNILPVKGLAYQQTFGYSNVQGESHIYKSTYHRENVFNNITGSASLGFSKTERLTTEGYFSYDNDFSGHKISAVLGYSYNQYDGESFSMSNSNFSIDGVKYWDMGKGSYLNAGLASMESSKSVTEKLLAFFARANYSYKNRYLFSATYRREGSSKFGKKNRWGDFWAVSAGWNIMQEPFMKSVTFIDDLKLRVGYGVTGNNDFSATYSGNFIGADENRWLLPNGEWKYTYGRSEDVNPNLGWETKAELNLGLDFSFFKNRLWGKVDLFQRKISDMLFYVRVPQPPYIRGYQWQNIGSMVNKGWEVELGGDIIRSMNFTWTTAVNLSHSTSRVLTMDGSNTSWDGGQLPGPNSPGKAIILREGSTIGQFFIYKFAGFSPAGQFLIEDRKGQVIPAASKVADDRQLLGNFTPKAMFGWSNNLSYKNFDLSINMHGWLGFDVYNTYAMCLGIAKVNGECNVLKAANSTFSHIKDTVQMTDYYLEDGSFLKIDAITLGYLLPLRKYTRFVDSLKLYATCGNVATITGYTGLDPEVDIIGYDGGIDNWQNAYPLTRTWTFGVQLKF